MFMSYWERQLFYHTRVTFSLDDSIGRENLVETTNQSLIYKHVLIHSVKVVIKSSACTFLGTLSPTNLCHPPDT